MNEDCKCEIEKEKEYWRKKSIKQSEYIEKFFLDRENKIYEDIEKMIDYFRHIKYKHDDTTMLLELKTDIQKLKEKVKDE